MKNHIRIFSAMSFAVYVVSGLLSSCINPDYELSDEHLNMDMTLFQEGISFPLGKTVPFTMGELYDQYGKWLEDYLSGKLKSNPLLGLGQNIQVGVELDTDEIPEMITELFVSGDIGVGGSVTNGLPLQFELELHLLDMDGNDIPFTKGNKRQEIKPCALDGTPKVTELTVLQSLKVNAQASEIKTVRLLFTATAAFPDAKFDEDSFLQGSLTALIPKGLSFNLEEISGLEGVPAN